MLKTHNRTALLALLLMLTGLLVALSPGAGAIEPDARSFAMGGAYTAVARGVSCTYWNPAGFADSSWLDISGSIGASVLDVDEFRKLLKIKEGDESITSANTSMELGLGGGASFRFIGLGAWVIGDIDAAGNKNEGTFEATAAFRGDLAVGAGTALPFALPGLGPISVGVNVKHANDADGEVSQVGAPTGSDYTLTTTESYRSASGYAMDIGAMAHPTDTITVALVAKDIGGELSGEKRTAVTEEHYASDGTLQSSNKISEQTTPYSKQLQTTFRAGIAYRPPVPGLLLAADFEKDGTIRAGCEYALPAHIIILRGGAIISPDQSIRYRAGAGVRFGMLNVDLGVGLNEGKSASVMLQGGISF